MNQEALVNLLSLGVRRGASDIHFEVGYPPAYRFKGELVAARLEVLTAQDTEAIALLIAGPDDPFTRGDTKDVDRSYAVPGLSRFRVNLFRQRGSVGLVMRVIPFEIPKLEGLNLPPIIGSLSNVRHGLLLVTGATGNGKSTTIASILEVINQNQRAHIVTIEDPIEFLHGSAKAVVVQREVGSDTESFATALKAVLRQDPDVIMVGEMRDRETAEICLKAAETGHLVISSLHTQDVPRTISRLVGMFPPEEQHSVRGRLAETLKAIVALRLLVRADGSGLVPAAEIMLMTRSLQEHVREGVGPDQILGLIEKGGDLGMQTFDQHLIELVKQNVIAPEAARTHATNPADVARALMLDETGPGIDGISF